MANRVMIHVTKFVDLDSEGKEGSVSYGLRVADDYEATYSNLLKKEQIVGASPREILGLAIEIDVRSHAMIEHAQEHHEGITIGGDYYTWAEILPLQAT